MGIIKKHKRIYYRSGMISLVFIPLLCLWFFCKNDSFKEYRSIQVNGPVDKDKFFNEFKIPNLRKYKELEFNNSEVFEKSKLDNLQASLRDLKIKNDTVNGFKIHLGKNTHYSVFVRIIDMFAIVDIPTYFIYKNDIWVFVPPVRKKAIEKETLNIPMISCGLVKMSKEDELRFEEEIERREFQLLIADIKKYWMLYLGYFGIVLLNIFALIKFNKR